MESLTARIFKLIFRPVYTIYIPCAGGNILPTMSVGNNNSDPRNKIITQKAIWRQLMVGTQQLTMCLGVSYLCVARTIQEFVCIKITVVISNKVFFYSNW